MIFQRRKDSSHLEALTPASDHDSAGFRLHPVKYAQVALFSGGAAWADHIAVSLYLLVRAETLHLSLPAEFINGKFTEQENYKSPGNIANYYHKLFSQKMGGNTLAGIKIALEQGATSKVFSNGFKARNLEIAKKGSDLLIAFTWGEGDTPKSGGTSHTWNASKAKKRIHVPLGTL